MEFDHEAKFVILNLVTNAGADLIGDSASANPEYARAIYELTDRIAGAL